MNKMIIRKVWLANKQSIKLITVPKNCNIKAGDYVKLVKIEE